MAKNIVVFSDGTGQEGGKGLDTNVYKLFRICENRTERQVVFYDRGLGTDAHPTPVQRFLGSATGFGISRNLLDCYQFIFDNFMAEDKIYLFGFSRGATTVRSLAGFIQLFGIIPKSRPELIKQAYKIYKIPEKKKRKAQAKAFVKKHHCMGADIKFLGVWDTVAALGVPWPKTSALLNKIPWFRHKFHDLNLSKNVLNAYHALSIDDDREVFHPALWNEKKNSNQNMQQTWFAGAHTDVGGGYEDAGLSDIAFNWMLKHAENCDLRIYERSRRDLVKTLAPNFDGEIHSERTGAKKMLFKQKTREWSEKDDNGVVRHPPQLHPAVFERINKVGSRYKPWILSRNPVVEEDVQPISPEDPKPEPVT